MVSLSRNACGTIRVITHDSTKRGYFRLYSALTLEGGYRPPDDVDVTPLVACGASLAAISRSSLLWDYPRCWNCCFDSRTATTSIIMRWLRSLPHDCEPWV